MPLRVHASSSTEVSLCFVCIPDLSENIVLLEGAMFCYEKTNKTISIASPPEQNIPVLASNLSIFEGHCKPFT